MNGVRDTTSSRVPATRPDCPAQGHLTDRLRSGDDHREHGSGSIGAALYYVVHSDVFEIAQGLLSPIDMHIVERLGATLTLRCGGAGEFLLGSHTRYPRFHTRMINNLSGFGLAQAFADVLGVPVLQINKRVDRFTNDVAAVAVLRFGDLVERGALLGVDLE